jgi:hypothetical protein
LAQERAFARAASNWYAVSLAEPGTNSAATVVSALTATGS